MPQRMNDHHYPTQNKKMNVINERKKKEIQR